MIYLIIGPEWVAIRISQTMGPNQSFLPEVTPGISSNVNHSKSFNTVGHGVKSQENLSKYRRKNTMLGNQLEYK